MTIREVLGLVYLVLAALSSYAPWLLLQGRPQWDGATLAATYPDVKWVRYAYPVLYGGWMVLAILGFFALFNSSGWVEALAADYLFFMLGAALSTLLILNGLFTLISGVCPLPKRRGMLYVHDEDLQPTGFLLIALGLLISLVGVVVIYFRLI